MRDKVKLVVGLWVGWQICQSTLGVLTRRIWRGVERRTERFARNMGWAT